jgi:hypothetical protein
VIGRRLRESLALGNEAAMHRTPAVHQAVRAHPGDRIEVRLIEFAQVQPVGLKYVRHRRTAVFAESGADRGRAGQPRPGARV